MTEVEKIHAEQAREIAEFVENTTQKDVAGALDAAAARAESINQYSATGRQCWYLAHLILENQAIGVYRGYLLDTSATLTKRDASEMISNFLN